MHIQQKILTSCLAMDAVIRCSVWQYVSQSKVDWIHVFVMCLVSETEISTEYKNKTNTYTGISWNKTKLTA